MPLELGLLDQQGNAISLFDLVIDAECRYETRQGGATLLLSVREPTTVVKFSYLESKPVVSFLRNFSAPVKVAYVREHAELAFLAEHDTDGFVKWDALQTLWLKWFTDADQLQGVDLISTVGGIAEQAMQLGDDAERKLLSASMLAVPDENYLFEELAIFEVDDLLDAREHALDELADAHFRRWVDMYKTFRGEDAYQPSASGMADRSLSNIAFGYAARSMRGEELNDFVQQHYRAADNLTDRQAALRVVCRHPHLEAGIRETLLDDFYQRWQSEALVVDLWFSMQAQSPLTTIEGLAALQNHEKFDLKNPNRARSVFSAFGTYNNRRMHALDGSGYQFLSDAVTRMDAFNPQVAARIVTPLTRWQRYDERRQTLMRAQLETLVAGPDISKDLYEIVTKSLG